MDEISEEAARFLQEAQDVLTETGGLIGEVSDGHHSFNELYHHRSVLFALLCHCYQDRAWKSKQHFDPDADPMFPDMFVAGIHTPAGEVTYHSYIDPYWDMYHVAEIPNAPRWDGAAPEQCIYRLLTLQQNDTALQVFTNNFTLDCDTYLDEPWNTMTKNPALSFHTQLYIDPVTAVMDEDTACWNFKIRYPGATRGILAVDPEGIVTDILWNETAYSNPIVACYRQDIIELNARYTGTQISGLREVIKGLEVTRGEDFKLYPGITSGWKND